MVFMVPLIMKSMVLWVVATCAVAADLPCDEYCACISTGACNIAYQPDCACRNIVREFSEQLKGSSIYYEPAEYLPVSALIYEQPFYILNPYAAIPKKRATYLNTARNSKPYHINRAPSTQIEINIDNAPYSHRRKEKDIQINNKHASIYLDIDAEPEESEISPSKNIFTVDDLMLTEQSLIECANLYSELDHRKNKGLKDFDTGSPNSFSKYEHISDNDLLNKINDKCSEISSIVEKSLNEIKDKRPKKLTLRMHNNEEEANELQLNNEQFKPKHSTDMTNKKEAELQTNVSEDNISEFDDDINNNERTVIIYTDSGSDENTAETYHTLLPITTSITVTEPSSQNKNLSSKVDLQKDIQNSLMDTTKTSKTIIYPATTTNDNTKYAFDTETTTPSNPTTETSTSNNIFSVSNTGQDVAENQRSNQEIDDSSTELESQTQIKEDVPLLKVITREFSNTIQSFINGTEDVHNGDFEDEIYNDNNETTEITTTRVGEKDEFPDVSGRLYFIYKQHHIPAKFVQKPTGTLQLGIDAETLCDKLTQDDGHKSVLIKTLCDCYKSDSCITSK